MLAKKDKHGLLNLWQLWFLSAFVISIGIFNEIKLAKIRSEGKIVIGEEIDSGKLEKKVGLRLIFKSKILYGR